MGSVRRNYSTIAAAVAACCRAAQPHDQDARFGAVVDALWHEFHNQGVSWVGFYFDQPNEADDRRLRLGPCRDKPACSPIGVHGVCGQALLSGQVRIVRDVRDLGGNYVACDPRDRSEIVVPIITTTAAGDACSAVLDLDSWEVGAFDESDALGLHEVLRAAGLVNSDASKKKRSEHEVRSARFGA